MARRVHVEVAESRFGDEDDSGTDDEVLKEMKSNSARLSTEA